MIRRFLVILFTGLTTITIAYGQNRQHTLGDLWPGVEQNYSGVKARQSAIEAASINEQAVKSRGLPQIRAQFQNSYGTYDGTAGAFFPQPGLFNISGLQNNLKGASFSPNFFGSTILDWNLFSFGSQKKQNEAAKIITNKSQTDKEAYILSLKKELSDRYINLLYSEAKLQWNIKNLDRLRDIRIITSGLASSGLKPAADSLLASSSYLQSLSENDLLEGEKAAALIHLEELVPNYDTGLNSSTFPFLNPGKELNASELNPTIDTLHPVLISIEKQAQFYKLNDEIQKAAALPSLNLLAGYAYRGSGINTHGTVSGKWIDGFSNNSNNFLIGVGLTWNITDLRTNHLKGKSFLKEAEGEKYLHAQVEEVMNSDLSATMAKIQQQVKQLQKAALAETQAGQAYNMYLARYKSGLIDLSELLQIQILLVKAENNHIEAARGYWLLLAKEAALTTDFSFIFNNL